MSHGKIMVVWCGVEIHAKLKVGAGCAECAFDGSKLCDYAHDTRTNRGHMCTEVALSYFKVTKVHAD